MMLRESVGHNEDGRFNAIVDGAQSGDAGVEHGAMLMRFADALLSDDGAALVERRNELRATLGDPAFVDAAAVAGFFNGIDRVADATGTPVDKPYAAMAGDLPSRLGIDRFPGAQRT